MEEQDDILPQDLVVNMPGCPALSMNLAHGCHNNVILHAVDCRNTSESGSGSGGPLCEVFWRRGAFPPWWRQLANEAAGVFVDVQACAVDQGEAALRLSLVKLSRRYRSCLRACMLTVTSHDDEEDPERLEQHRQVLSRMEMVWNLCEILLIEQKRGGVVLYQLLDWLCQHATQFDRSMTDVTDAEVAESHPEYWNTVYGLALQGRHTAARKLLRLHSGCQTDPFVSADELLRKVPVFGDGGGVADFEQRWRHWQEQCIRRLEDGEFNFSPRLQTLVKILCGDAATFEELYQLMGTWYHLMISYTLYSRPWVGVFELSHAAEDSVLVFGGAAHRSHLDVMLQAAVDGDVLTLLKTAQVTLPDGWLTAHLADLLHKLHSAHAPSAVPSSVRPAAFLGQLRHHLLLEYGDALMAAGPLWQLGAVYLDRCGAAGRAHTALLLGRLEPSSARTANKIMQAAEARGLTEVSAGVALVMARRAMRRRQLGAALAWALRADGAALASRLADTLVRQYAASGRFSSADFIDNLGSCMLKSDRLLFLGKYREFHCLHEQGELSAAAELLVTLMTSQLAPQYFWMTLLTDSVPLLDNDDVIISSRHTVDLIGCMEQLQRSDKLDESSDEVKQIRRALSHNLARAIVAENTVAS